MGDSIYRSQASPIPRAAHHGLRLSENGPAPEFARLVAVYAVDPGIPVTRSMIPQPR